MDEGKPTKPKWWSRPRSRGVSGLGEEAVPPAGPADSDGDFLLAAPESGTAPADAVTGKGPDLPEADGDVERGAKDSGGDYELMAPRDSSTPEGAEPAVPVAPAAIQQIVAVEHAPTVGTDTTTGPCPDSASTPPYGVPGPWAPAPPVQAPVSRVDAPPALPGAAPAPSTDRPGPAPAAPPASGTPLPPPPHGTPAPWQNYDPWAPVPAPLQQTGAAVESEDARRRRTRRALFVGAVLLALVAGGAGGVVGAYLERNGVAGDVVELPQAAKEPSGRAPGTVAGIAARALPGVVTLHVSGTAESGTGTGFVLDNRGHILTNNHVVEPAGADGKISVTFHSGDTAQATVVGRDSGYDLAVVEVRSVRGLRPIPLGNSDSVQVGDPVVAIGAPFDLEGTVTSGIISAKERPVTAGGESGDGSDVSYVDALQTDAPINPGNSGGPLLDSRARVVGINSAIRSVDDGSRPGSGQAGSIGLGFAIPVNQAKRVAEELINTGRATHPVIGVTLDMDYTGDGARVGTKGSGGGPAVTEGGPGDRAGIEAGDVITEVDGRRVHSGDELIVRTRAHRPGDRLRLTLERAGKELTVSLTLGSASGG
ncbi:S1C family serine protease [Streptomyces sp. WSLK1-3]|uniref:S1C family serine protease n=1 Tax=Streptomyces sp. WSLK1-3 TaxID=3375475 RepID=UPI003799A4F0